MPGAQEYAAPICKTTSASLQKRPRTPGMYPSQRDPVQRQGGMPLEEHALEEHACRTIFEPRLHSTMM